MPDLNTVPVSPHFLGRRISSQQMPSPSDVPSSPSLDILPSNQVAVNQGIPVSPSPLPSPRFASSFALSGSVAPESTMSGPGTGPVRHPRPYTNAEIHQVMEKEGEAMVSCSEPPGYTDDRQVLTRNVGQLNHLHRELSLARSAQNASVISNTSSVSGATPGADARRHSRTGSNTSTRSFNAVPTMSTTSLAPISSPAPVRPSNNPASGGASMSRQSSSTSRRSQAGSPTPGYPSSTPASLTQSHLNDLSFNPYFPNRMGPSSSNLTTAGTSGPTSAPTATPGTDVRSPGIIQGTRAYEETAYFREGWENAKRENEALKQQIRDLERKIRERRSSDASQPGQRSSSQQRQASRSRSESVSTTASFSVAASTTGGGASIAAQREERPRVVSMLSTAGSVGVGVPEEEVRVGESASNAGLVPRD